MPKLVDAVFEGGGVKGIGLVGAVSVVEEEGYSWANLAGTSAGAIVAALAAAGYRSSELQAILNGLDYRDFKDCAGLGRVPIVGHWLSVLVNKGIYRGDFVEQWMRELLAKKGMRTFGDLRNFGQTDPRYRYKLSVITSDVSNGLLVVLPTGVERYGVDPDKLDVARAVRMSISIPFFFEPVTLGDAYFVDGGILSNYPLWIFDSDGPPEWPTFGFKLVGPEEGRPNSIQSPIDFAKAIIGTMMDAHDNMHVANADFTRTIAIPTMGVRTTEFDLSPAKRDELFRSGANAAREFFKTWSFDAYILEKRHRQADPQYQAHVERQKQSLAR